MFFNFVFSVVTSRSNGIAKNEYFLYKLANTFETYKQKHRILLYSTSIKSMLCQKCQFFLSFLSRNRNEIVQATGWIQARVLSSSFGDDLYRSDSVNTPLADKSD